MRSLRSVRLLSGPEATALLRRQLETWRQSGLLVDDDLHLETPQMKTSRTLQRRQIATDDVRRAAPNVFQCIQLVYLESRYRRRIQKEGLAKTLVTLQRESGPSATKGDMFVVGALKSYYLSRRAFKQSKAARDCLYRSLGLSAFLRRNGIGNDLCIGITDVPFTSHAWVERDGCVLNDTLEKANEYVVIGRF